MDWPTLLVAPPPWFWGAVGLVGYVLLAGSALSQGNRGRYVESGALWLIALLFLHEGLSLICFGHPWGILDPLP
jgi:hypothetical protein